MKRLVTIAAVCLLGQSLVPAYADVVYATGFESPSFVTGGIAGQDGWLSYNSPAASTIQNTVVASGAQAARVDGSVGGQHGPYYSTTTTATSLVLSADILLTSSAASSGWQFAGLGAGLIGFAGGIDVFGTTIQAITAGFPVIGTLALDVWNHVDIFLDFDAQATSIALNGTTLASGLAFCGDNGPCAGATVSSLRTVIFDSFGAQGAADAGYLDNFSISTVPEPSTLALVGLALLGGVGASRRKSFR